MEIVSRAVMEFIMSMSICESFKDLFDTIHTTKNAGVRTAELEGVIDDFGHHLTVLEGFLALGVGEELVNDLSDHSDYFLTKEYVPESMKEHIRVITA